MTRKDELTQAEIADALRVIMSVDCGVDARVVAWQRIYDNNTEQRQRIEELEQQNAALREALQLLYDVQNGSPLPKYQADWGKAMEMAERLLKEHP